MEGKGGGSEDVDVKMEIDNRDVCVCVCVRVVDALLLLFSAFSNVCQTGMRSFAVQTVELCCWCTNSIR
jgi:hypothetical protein